MKTPLAWLVPLALVGCSGPARPASDRASDPAAETAAAAPPRDSTWVEVRGPTLIAFWPQHAQAVLDSGDADDATALDDFGSHLTSADSTLRALGFRVVSVEGPRFHVVSAGRAATFAPPADSGDIGFYLVAPGRTPAISYGVQTDADLVEIARRYLAGGAHSP